MRKEGDFEFEILGKHFPFYEVRENNFLHGGISPSFLGQEIVILGTDSILTRSMMVKYLIVC